MGRILLQVATLLHSRNLSAFFLVLLFFYQIWFQLWFAVSLVLTIGYGYPEHRIKRNVIPGSMLVLGVMFYVVCWCGLFGRKRDGSHGAAQRTDVRDSAKNQDEGDKNDNNNLAIQNFRNNNNNVAGGLRKRNLAGQTIALSDAPIVAPRQECLAV